MTAESSKKRLKPPAAFAVVVVVSVIGLITIANLDTFAKWLSNEGYVREAIFCYEMVTGIQGLLGVRNVRLSDDWADLASCYSRIPRKHDAVRAQMQAVKIREDLYGAEEPYVLGAQADLGEMLTAEGNLAQAEKVLTQALQHAEQSESPEFVSYGLLLSAYADLLIKQGNFDKAIETLKKLTTIDDRLISERGKSFDSRDRMALVLARRQEYSEAQKLIDESMDLKKSVIGPDALALYRSYEYAGRLLLAQGKKDDAKLRFKQGVSILKRHYGNDSRRVIVADHKFDEITQSQKPLEP